MTQGIPYRSSSYTLTPADRARVHPSTEAGARTRTEGWFAEAIHSLARAILHRRLDSVPDSLLEDVGLGHRVTAREFRSEFNRLDAQLHARFY